MQICLRNTVISPKYRFGRMIYSTRIEVKLIKELRHKHTDHAVLPGRDEEFTVTASADVQVCARNLRSHRFVDKLL